MNAALVDDKMAQQTTLRWCLLWWRLTLSDFRGSWYCARIYPPCMLKQCRFGEQLSKHLKPHPILSFNVLSGPISRDIVILSLRHVTLPQKESGKRSLAKKVTKKWQKHQKKWPKSDQKSPENEKVIELLLPTSFCGTLNTPFRAILFGEVSTPPKGCDTPPLALSFTQAHLCDTPFCNVSRNSCAMPHKNKHERVLRYYRYKSEKSGCP